MNMFLNKKYLIVISFLLLIPFNIKALSYNGCDYTTVATYKSLINNINVSYDYVKEGNNILYKVTLNNLVDNTYFVDTATDKEYKYSDSINGEITLTENYGGKNKFVFYLTDDSCNGTKVGEKYYTLPYYNSYYVSDICFGIQDFELCKKWLNSEYNAYDFDKKIIEYKKSLSESSNVDDNVVYKKSIADMLVGFYVKYYYFLLIGIITICSSVIIIQRRKTKFDLKV